MESKNKKWLVLGLVLIILIIGLGLFNKTRPGDDIKIGVIASLTGPGAYFGEQLVSGLQLALADINAKGGVDGQKISLIIEDSKTDNTTALTVAKKLVEVDNVKVIIGDSWNGTTLTMMPYTNEKKVIVLSPNASLDAFTKDDYLFRLVPKTSDLMKPLAEYLANSGVKTVAVTYAKSAFGDEHSSDFKAEFEKRGGSIVAVESFDMRSTDVRTELTHIKSVKPDVIFDLHASGPSVGLLIAQANQLGIKTNYVGTWSVENSALLKQYGKEIEGIIYPFIFSESESTTTQNFADKVKAGGKVSDTFIASGYDALNIIAKVLTETKNTDGDSLKKALLEIKNYDGVSGKLGFDQNGDIIKNIFMKTVKDGQFVKLGE